jgi:hypothetical protein
VKAATTTLFEEGERAVGGSPILTIAVAVQCARVVLRRVYDATRSVDETRFLRAQRTH